MKGREEQFAFPEPAYFSFNEKFKCANKMQEITLLATEEQFGKLLKEKVKLSLQYLKCRWGRPDQVYCCGN